jgi:hypothetical protein
VISQVFHLAANYLFETASSPNRLRSYRPLALALAMLSPKSGTLLDEIQQERS